MAEAEILKAENSHIFKREDAEHYVEPEWCSRRLFEVEKFEGTVQDPSCGFGRIVLSGLSAGLPIVGTMLIRLTHTNAEAH